MLLERVEIVGFRGINRLSLQLEQNNVLIGENAWGKSSLLDALTLLLSPEENLYHFVHDDFWFPPGDVNGREKHLHIILTFRESEPGRHRVRRFRPMSPCWVPCEDGFQRIFYRLEGEMAQNDGVLTLREFLDEKEIRSRSIILTSLPAILSASPPCCAYETRALCGGSVTAPCRICPRWR